MQIKIIVPNLPESVSDATVAAWHKQVGERVRKDEPLVDLETDKVVLEVPALADGLLESRQHEQGAIVVGGDLLGVLKSGLTDPVKESNIQSEVNQLTTPTSPSQEIPPLSPAVRRLIAEHHLDPGLIKGSGRDGRLTKSDILEFLQQTPAETSEPIASLSKDPAPISPQDPFERLEERVPMTRLRAKIAERLVQAQQTAAMLTTFNEVDMSHIMGLRKHYQSTFTERHETKLGFMSFFVKASLAALKRFPAVNASIDEASIVYHGYYDIGIAVASDRGLVVPVLQNVDHLDFAGIEKKIVEYGQKARQSKLSYEELSGGTFTITNGGIFGSMLSTPILNPPQSAILGMHAINDRAMVIEGAIVIRPIMYLALSYDHRIVDGREAVQFLFTIKENLEDPSRLLLNI